MQKSRDPAVLAVSLSAWIRERVERAGPAGVVFGLSGGIDPAVVCGLAARARGPERCLGVVMPIGSVPKRIVERAPSAGLWEGQTDEEELGITYRQIDACLEEGSSGSAEADAEIRQRFLASRHKRELPPVATPA